MKRTSNFDEVATSLIDQSSIEEAFTDDFARSLAMMAKDKRYQAYFAENKPDDIIARMKDRNLLLCRNEIKSDIVQLSQHLGTTKLNSKQRHNAVINHAGISAEYHSDEITNTEKNINKLENKSQNIDQLAEEVIEQLAIVSSHRVATQFSQSLAKKVRSESHGLGKKSRTLQSLESIGAIRTSELNDDDVVNLINKKTLIYFPNHLVCNVFNISYDNLSQIANQLAEEANEEFNTIMSGMEQPENRSEHSSKMSYKERIKTNTIQFIHRGIILSRKNNPSKSLSDISKKQLRKMKNEYEENASSFSKNIKTSEHSASQYVSNKYKARLCDTLEKPKRQKELTKTKPIKAVLNKSWIVKGRKRLDEAKKDDSEKKKETSADLRNSNIM